MKTRKWAKKTGLSGLEKMLIWSCIFVTAECPCLGMTTWLAGGHLEACKSLIVRVRMLKVLRASNLFVLKKWNCGGQQILEGVLEYSVERRIWVVAIHRGITLS